MGKVLIAFSGGKDSFFLLQTALESLGENNVQAVTVHTDLLTGNDYKRVEYFREKYGFPLEEIVIDISGHARVMENPVDRCYHCKREIFNNIKEHAQKKGIEHVLDGTTFSDLSEYRPGLKALKELGIRSPLKDAEITSHEVVAYLGRLDIHEFYLTSSTCLATRFPYDHHLEKNELRIFGEIESFVVEMGIYPVRIRYIDQGIRIETPKENFNKIIENRENINRFVRDRGLKFITLDLEGIKSGVWD